LDWALVGELKVQRRAFVRDGALLVCAAAMAETAVGGSPSTGPFDISLSSSSFYAD
jgi:hypothetical protein